MKRSHRMMADVDQFGLYLSLAFDHFSKTLDVPLDYVQASLKCRPSPETLAENVFEFVELVGQKRGIEGEIQTLFDDVTDLVASCITLDASRRGLLGKSWCLIIQFYFLDGFSFGSPSLIHNLTNTDPGRPMEWFEASESNGQPRTETKDNRRNQKRGLAESGNGSYGALCRAAIDEYQLKRTPCAYSGSQNSTFKCDLYESTHSAEHLEKAKFGRYHSVAGGFEHPFDQGQFDWPQRVRNVVTSLSRECGWSFGGGHRQIAVAAHTKALKRFYGSVVSDPLGFISHTICLSCLFQPAQYLLSCGHVICLECALDYGQTEAGRTQVVVKCCPLHNECTQTGPSTIHLNPPHSGLRILTLDG